MYVIYGISRPRVKFRRADGKTLSLLRWARLFSPAPCQCIRGIRAPRRLRTPRGGPGGRGRRRTRSPRTARKSPLTRWECSGGIIPRNFPLRPAYPPNLQNLGGLADAPRPGLFPRRPPGNGCPSLLSSQSPLRKPTAPRAVFAAICHILPPCGHTQSVLNNPYFSSHNRKWTQLPPKNKPLREKTPSPYILYTLTHTHT